MVVAAGGLVAAAVFLAAIVLAWPRTMTMLLHNRRLYILR